MSYQELQSILLSIQNKAQMVCPFSKKKDTMPVRLFEEIPKYISYLERAIQHKAYLQIFLERRKDQGIEEKLSDHDSLLSEYKDVSFENLYNRRIYLQLLKSKTLSSIIFDKKYGSSENQIIKSSSIIKDEKMTLLSSLISEHKEILNERFKKLKELDDIIHKTHELELELSLKTICINVDNIVKKRKLLSIISQNLIFTYGTTLSHDENHDFLMKLTKKPSIS